MSNYRSILNRLFDIREEIEESKNRKELAAFWSIVNCCINLESEAQDQGLIPFEPQPDIDALMAQADKEGLPF